MTAVVTLWGRGGVVTGEAMVDDEDLDLASAHRWHLSTTGYARTTVLHPLGGIRPNGRPRLTNVYLHRLLVGVPGCGVDHINRDRLDDRRSNLRLATQAQNVQNCDAYGASGVRGVYWRSDLGKWQARVKLDRRSHHLGYFADKETAAAAASSWRRVHMPYAVENP